MIPNLIFEPIQRPNLTASPALPIPPIPPPPPPASTPLISYRAPAPTSSSASFSFRSTHFFLRTSNCCFSRAALSSSASRRSCSFLACSAATRSSNRFRMAARRFSAWGGSSRYQQIERIGSLVLVRTSCEPAASDRKESALFPIPRSPLAEFPIPRSLDRVRKNKNTQNRSGFQGGHGR